MSTYTTAFGSLDGYTKGDLEIIDDDPKRYTCLLYTSDAADEL